jgi:hypothetical protein
MLLIAATDHRGPLLPSDETTRVPLATALIDFWHPTGRADRPNRLDDDHWQAAASSRLLFVLEESGQAGDAVDGCVAFCQPAAG